MKDLYSAYFYERYFPSKLLTITKISTIALY